MKTFESEYKELWRWFDEKNKEYLVAIESRSVGGLDSELDYDRHKDVLEYNRRLSELKRKYNIRD